MFVASSITAVGRSAISTSILAFESFLANNVKFNSLDEIICFIDNVIHEPRVYNDDVILDRNITIGECFFKLFSNCDYDYPPNDKDMDIVWDLLGTLTQQDWNRIYYKNNLYDFVDNKFMTNALIYILQSLKMPYLNPNKVPKEIEVELEEFWLMIREYVYYGYMYLDKSPRVEKMYRDVVLITDTDSCIVSLDAWYRFVLNKIQSVPMAIKTELVNPIKLIKTDEFGDRPLISPIEFVDPPTDYDFMSDEIIELERTINPVKIIPQDGLRFSILNILAYCLTKMVNETMVNYTKNSFSYSENRKCMLRLKNEFTFRMLLLMKDAMKNYVTIQELQEGNIVPESESLDIKGLPMTKSGLQESTRERLKEILYEEIMNTDSVSQIRVIKELAKFEKEIFLSIESGSKQYFKPVKIKAMYSYDNPMKIQGIVASLVWNTLKRDGEPAIDLQSRNSIDIAKVDINKKNIDKIKDDYPDIYDKLVELMQDKKFEKITSIAIPLDAVVPEWVKEFIDYDTIISDNIKTFPLSPIGIATTKNGTYSNIIQL